MVLEGRASDNGVNGIVDWLALSDSHLSVVAPISFIVVSGIVVVIVCVVCCRRPCAASKPTPPQTHVSQVGRIYAVFRKKHLFS